MAELLAHSLGELLLSTMGDSSPSEYLELSPANASSPTRAPCADISLDAATGAAALPPVSRPLRLPNIVDSRHARGL